MQTFEETLGFALMVGFTAALAIIVSTTRLPVGLKRIIYAGLGFRVVGAWLRYTVLFEVYGGTGDARGYYGRGLQFASYFTSLDFSPFYDPSLWFRGEWTGTGFLSFPSGIVLSLIGPSLLGEFVAFSLLAFLGLIGFVVAFRRACPHIPAQRYAFWVFLFPSLWFWPSSVGKEAVMMLGIGLAVWGFIGKNERVQWPILAAGTFLVGAIRPQVAAVVIFSLVVAYWISFGSRWTLSKAVQGAAILAVGLAGMWFAMARIGVEGFDVEGVQEYMEREAAGAAGGGSDVARVTFGPSGIPIALVNILTRPWPWEARNAMALLSSLEILGLWAIVFYRRKNFFHALKTWRSNPLLRVAIPFILAYSISLGMLVINLGIVARQRVFLFPFLFLLLEAAPAPRKRKRMRHRPQPFPAQGAPDTVAEQAIR
jgi:hypothetical protein